MSVIDDGDDDCSSSSGGGGTVLPGMAAGADCCTISARTAAPPEHMRSPSSLVTLHTHTCPCSCKILRQVLAAPATLLPLRLHHPLPALLILIVQHATPQQSSLPCLPALMRACCRRLHCAKSPSSITQAASQTQQRGICHGHGAVYCVRIHTPHGKATATQRVQRLNVAASRDS